MWKLKHHCVFTCTVVKIKQHCLFCKLLIIDLTHDMNNIYHLLFNDIFWDVLIYVGQVVSSWPLSREKNVITSWFLPICLGTEPMGLLCSTTDLYRYALTLTHWDMHTHTLYENVFPNWIICQSCQEAASQNGQRWNSSKSRLYTPFAVCVISKFPYYNALRDCLTW